MSETEQAEEIKRLIECHQRRGTFFDALKLNIETCTVAEVSRSYRRLALLLHPDKCSLPHGAEAFQVAEKAYKALSQEAVLISLQRAFHRKRDREEEENAEAGKSKSSFPSRGGASGAASSANEASASPTSPQTVAFGTMSKLASSGLSTEEQKTAEIKRLLLCKPTDYFLILDVNPESCEVRDVNKQYRRMAQALHPDKCSLPRVSDAFAVFERAHKELCDTSKLTRFRIAFKQQQERELKIQAELARRSTQQSNRDCGGDELTPESRAAMRKQNLFREQQLESARLAEEVAFKRQKVEEARARQEELSAALEKQKSEWDNSLF